MLDTLAETDRNTEDTGTVIEIDADRASDTLGDAVLVA